MKNKFYSPASEQAMQAAKENKLLKSETMKLKADTDYIAMMTGIELDISEEGEDSDKA